MPAKGKPIFQNNTDEHPVEDRYEIRSDRYPPALRCSYVRPNGVRCRRFAVRMGTCCPFHHNSKTVAKRKKEAELVRDLAEIIRDSIEGVKLAQVSLREGAPEAVQFLRDVVGNEDVAMPTRVKAAESLVRFSGTSLERPDQNTINVLVANGPNATDLIRERLDRLQSAAELASDSQTIAGAIEPS